MGAQVFDLARYDSVTTGWSGNKLKSIPLKSPVSLIELNCPIGLFFIVIKKKLVCTFLNGMSTRYVCMYESK